MATLVLAAAGSAIGSAFGGTVLGLSGAVIGRAIGATLGQAIDQRLFGVGSEAVDVGRADRMRLMGAGEGAALPLIWGRVRVGGQVIWASPFFETEARSGGKGAPRQEVVEFSYSVSLAVALGEGVILRVGRVWADGTEIDPDRLGMRVYLGDEDQQADPVIAAFEGLDATPAYRGTAYVVFEDLALAEFGNRVPQFSFEVMREAQGPLVADLAPFARSIRGVAMIPGTGEYALGTSKVTFPAGQAKGTRANVHGLWGGTDFGQSLRQMREELPECRSVSLVVSWFGDDLNCARCTVRPKVEQSAVDGAEQPWRAGGIARSEATLVPQRDGRPVYGGTPSDASVIEAIKAIRAGGQEVMFYPFVLMDQMPGNALVDPYSGAVGQPVMPWRGRITVSVAPGQVGSPDGSTAAAAEVAAFFGAARPADFTSVGGVLAYTGPPDWGYRRFILHCAHLCAQAGGVDAFCIGSEMRELTFVRGAAHGFPAVAALQALAADVRAILGPGTKISYAADWSEYSGLQRDGNRYFHLDPLWSDANIDFVGIDNYMPLADWRQSEVQADDAWLSDYDLGYLKANIAGGEGFDWYYDGPEGIEPQRRVPITDGLGEAWVYRVKDLASWWAKPHHDRIDGQRREVSTSWVPQSKPIVFTEYGCPAIDRGANQPNVFFDGLSSESAVPRGSIGRRDDLIQMQYFRAMGSYWADAANNPTSDLYGGPMVDMERAHAWAWDARPFPAFPAMTSVWSDGPNYARGHWLNGRATAQPLAAVVAEIAGRAGLDFVDVEKVYGLVRGYAVADVTTGRSALQPLMLVAGFDAVERDGVLRFATRNARVTAEIDAAGLVAGEDGDLDLARASDADLAVRLRVGFAEAEGDYRHRVADVVLPEAGGEAVLDQDTPLVLLPSEARGLAERWLAEIRVGRDTARFALPRSAMALGVGDVVALAGQRWRIDRLEQSEAQMIEAMRVEPGLYQAGPVEEDVPVTAGFVASVPVLPIFLDLPLLTGLEVPHAPHIAATATPWPGRVGVWVADGADGFGLNRILAQAAMIGETQTALFGARSGLWDRGPALRVAFDGGALSSAAKGAVLNGGNLAAIGDGSSDRWEVFQFADAVLVAPDTWELSLRLRGQAGTDAIMPTVWPIGSRVVILNRALQQIDLPVAMRGLARSYRIGALQRGFGDADVVARSEAFDGIGLRPYSVAHLRQAEAEGAIRISWVRRTRIDGDTWLSTEVPLGEVGELYLLRVMRSGAILREVTLNTATWVYAAAFRAEDGPEAVDVAVAQVSERFGPGPFRTIRVG